MWSKYNKNFNGRAFETTDAHKNRIPKYHDFIQFVPRVRENNYLKCQPFFEQGMSINEVARQTGIAHSTVHGIYKRNCLPNNKNILPKKLTAERQIVVKGGRVPYGYAYLNGKLLVDPKEYKNVLNIYRQWQKAQSYRAIARYLNDQGITTRAGKEWTNEIIKRIIDRHESDLKSTKNIIRKTK